MNTSRKNLKNNLATFFTVGTFLVCSTAQAGWTVWNNAGGNGLWSDADNWSGSVPDASSDAAIINGFSTLGAVTALAGSNDSFDYLRVGHLDSGKLIINGANLSTTASSQTREGIGYDAGHTGVLDLMSGSMSFSTPTNKTNQTTSIAGVGATGTVNQTGGTMNFGGLNTNSVTLGSNNGTGLYNFTAGAITTRRAFNITTGGSGSSIFQVNGYDASSSIQIGGMAVDEVGGLGDGAWLQGAGTTLSLGIDGGSSEGTTLINIGLGSDEDANDNDGKAVFASGSILDLGFNSGAQLGTWTVLSAAGGIVDNGLTLAPEDVGNWSFAVVGNDLQVTALAIPEPSSLALMAVVGCALLITRRRLKA
ncbi:PEP-CTERM sorting domain-containing protein [Kiritimatiellota bacterium B12222]|nr:PEP-CTERM sorting domain-containing protein [Kiritimatiellota bacterium B12222]